jgi:aminoglycoside phosphotransferase (APT) family kinase protein
MYVPDSDNTEDALPSRLTAEQVAAICRRAFGRPTPLTSVRELVGGTINSAYLLTIEPARNVLLRVAPPPSPSTSWDTAALMRREHAMRPFFAAIAHLMPQPLLVDFTHQLIDRDFMVQTYIEGERWDAVADDLTPAAHTALWQQFGTILGAIHATRGTVFGLPEPGMQFARWSQAIVALFERIHADMRTGQLDAAALDVIMPAIRTNTWLLDEMTEPRLLHGDLWLFNLIIQDQHTDSPRIVGVLDADRAWWGDPMADWTMFVLDKADGPGMNDARAAFWQAYGQPQRTTSAQLRSHVYDAMHAGIALLWATREDDQETIARAHHTLQRVADALSEAL